MKVLYTIGFSKLCEQSLGNRYIIENVNVDGEKMNVFFCKTEKGIFAVAGKYRNSGPYRSCGHWHSGRAFYDIYWRKHFRTPAEGNAFYLGVKRTRTIEGSRHGTV